jgi:hypothetical protein
MTRKGFFPVLWTLFFAVLLLAFGLTGISHGQAKGQPALGTDKAAESSGGKSAPLVQAKKRSVPLTGASVNKVLPPPCTVTAVRGKTVTLKDFKGEVDTVEVADAAGIRVGEKAVVKNGHLTLGLPPE